MPATPAPFVLDRSADRDAHNDALAAALGGRVGLEGVLEELPRSGRHARRTRLVGGTWGTAASAAWAWELRDDLSRRWWPQGVTTSADAGLLEGVEGREDHAGRHTVLTSAYSKVRGGVSHGARVSVLDLTDRSQVRYDHVLLVRAVATADGVRVEPVHSHAGGLVWLGNHLHVAATGRGVHTFRLDDLVPARGLGDAGKPRGQSHGHRWLLPVRCTHAARTDEGARPFRYSFLSAAREDDRVALIAGEYAPPSGRGSTRLVELAVDPATGLPLLDADGHARPTLLGSGVRQAQGVARADGRFWLSTSNGRFRRGSVWVGGRSEPVRPESFRQRPRTLPIGPEDLSSWPSRGELWTVTEHPGRRRLVVLDRARLR